MSNNHYYSHVNFKYSFLYPRYINKDLDIIFPKAHDSFQRPEISIRHLIQRWEYIKRSFEKNLIEFNSNLDSLWSIYACVWHIVTTLGCFQENGQFLLVKIMTILSLKLWQWTNSRPKLDLKDFIYISYFLIYMSMVLP